MSLWSVDDEATRAWMKALYEGRLRSPLDTSAAVRQASLKLLQERRTHTQSTHPFYWAAFVAGGDRRQPALVARRGWRGGPRPR